MKEYGTGATCSMHPKDYWNMQNYSEKYKNHLKNLDVHGRIIVKLILTEK
jgi:hypothetical protein